MNHGCSTTIPRPNGKVRNGTRKVLLVRRKHAWADPGWKLWLLFFPTSVVLCTKKFVPPWHTVNHAFYNDVLERLQKRVQRVRGDIANDWVLHHDNAPAHTALSIREFLAKKNIPVLPHPPYGPEPATCDFYLSLSWRVNISGRWKTYKNCNRWATYTYGKWLPVLLLSLDKTLEPVCDFPRVTLRRR